MKKKWYVAAVAACLVLALVLGSVLWPGGGMAASAYAIRMTEYPEMVQYPYLGDKTNASDAQYDKWRNGVNRQRRDGYESQLQDYLMAAIPVLMAGEGDNRAVSPLNIYIALAMLAECSDGQTRQQILDLLGTPDLETLRGTVDDLWNDHYRADGLVTSLLAGSVWLDKDEVYDSAILDTLAQQYHASSFQGQMGDADYNEALQAWLNDQTGGLLEEQIGQIETQPEDVLVLAATVYFKAPWRSKFNPSRNTQEIFHSPSGDVTAEFMHSSSTGNYYWGDQFGAVFRSLEGGGHMMLLLPDEGYTPEQLLQDPATLEFMLGISGRENSKHLIVNLSMPKFDVESKMQLVDALQSLGVTDVFDPALSDMPVVKGPAWVTNAIHGARVIADEEGVEAAAYTVIMTTGGTMPPTEEVDFVLDRPFIFMIQTSEGLPLFLGIVNQP